MARFLGAVAVLLGLAGCGQIGGGGFDSAGPPQPGDADFREVAFGTALPYGEIARSCAAPAGQLGTEVGAWPEGGGGYRLYDSAPGGTGLRTFYLTGFADGCPRQFSAALVLFASPESYEQIRYGPAGRDMPLSSTDEAYEAIKAQVCGVSRGQPCGRRMGRLQRDTVFLSVYERFGDNPAWKTILLHGGGIAAADVKG
jgi:hypothetical protein